MAQFEIGRDRLVGNATDGSAVTENCSAPLKQVYLTESSITIQDENNMKDQQQLMQSEVFIQNLGISRTTFWRWRKRGWVRSVNIAGRHYLSQTEVEKFNQRAEAGHFAIRNNLNSSNSRSQQE